MAREKISLALLSILLLGGLVNSCVLNPTETPDMQQGDLGSVRVSIGGATERTVAGARAITGVDTMVLELVHDTYPRIHATGSWGEALVVESVRTGMWQIRASLLTASGSIAYYGEAPVTVAPGKTSTVTIMVYATGGVDVDIQEGLFAPTIRFESVNWDDRSSFLDGPRVTVLISAAAGDPRPVFRFTCDGSDPRVDGPDCSYWEVELSLGLAPTMLLRAVSANAATAPDTFSEEVQFRYTTVLFQSGVFVDGASHGTDPLPQVNGVYWRITNPGDSFYNVGGNLTWRHEYLPITTERYYLYSNRWFNVGSGYYEESLGINLANNIGDLPTNENGSGSVARFYVNQNYISDRDNPTGWGGDSVWWARDIANDIAPYVYSFTGFYGRYDFQNSVNNRLTAAYELLETGTDLHQGRPEFQWYRARTETDDGIPISGANGAVYVTDAFDENQYLYVVIAPKDERGEFLGHAARSPRRLIGATSEHYNHVW